MPGKLDTRIDKVKIKIGGTPLTSEQAKKVDLITVDSSLFVPDMFELHIRELKSDEWEAIPYDVGKTCDIDLSDENEVLTPVIKGEITALEPMFDRNTISLIVRGYDKGHRLHRAIKSKTWLNVTDSDIAQQIAGMYGLSAQVDATSEVFKHLYQNAQSDFDFLLSRAERIGYTVFTQDGKLHFIKPSAPSGGVKLEWNKELITFRPRMTLNAQVSEVTVKGWDPKTKAPVVGTASSSAVNPKVGYGKSGPQAAATLGAAKRLFVRKPVNSQADATQIAQALLNQANDSYIEADGIAESVPTLHAGQVVKIEGVGSKFSGSYRLTSVRHEFSKGRYETFFRIEGRQPKLVAGLLSGGGSKIETQPWGGVVIGIVTNNKDPEANQGHIKVKYPWLADDQEAFWARLVAPGAGKDRGILFTPEVNDEVLIAFEHGDFNRPYVIGGLYNGKDAPPLAPDAAVKGGAVTQRQIKTRTGHTVTFYDQEGGQEYIEIKDAKGNTQIKFDTQNKKITMQSTDKVEILSTGDMTLKSQSGNITIEASAGKVDIKGNQLDAQGMAGAKLRSNASTEIEGLNTTVKGQTAAEVSGNMTLTLRGGIVRIN
jgi:phage protein D/phage baseplate assembly protein gpV